MADKVFIVNQQHRADYKIFFCDRDHNQKNHQLLEGCELTTKEYQAKIKVFVVRQQHQADVLITRDNFPD